MLTSLLQTPIWICGELLHSRELRRRWGRECEEEMERWVKEVERWRGKKLVRKGGGRGSKGRKRRRNWCHSWR